MAVPFNARAYDGGLHAPLAVAIAEDPSLARKPRMCVDIELAGTPMRG